MPADQEDVDAVYGVVHDAVRLLDWSGSSDAYLLDDEDARLPVLAESLVETYRAAIDEARDQFELALETLRGENRQFPLAQVLALLEVVGWTAALRSFKVAVLEQSGREEVMSVAREGRQGGGGIRRRVLRRFMGPLNAALDSVDGIPGVGVIKELKDFLEGAQGG